MSEHTPGPWKPYILDKPLSEIPTYVENTIKASGGETFYFVGADDERGEIDICHVGNGPRGLANAQLIAAAPDMVQEIERLHAELAEARASEHELRETSEGLCRWIDQLNGEPHADRCAQSKRLKAELAEARRDRDGLALDKQRLLDERPVWAEVLRDVESLREKVELYLGDACRWQSAVMNAPHDPLCATRGELGPCNCWKRAAIDAARKETP